MDVTVGGELTPPTLESCEAQMAGAYETVSEALWTIREFGLFRNADYDTFEEYCRARWGYSKSYAYRLVSDATTRKTLIEHDAAFIPHNEAQSRALQKAAKNLPKDAKANPDSRLVEAANRIAETYGTDVTAAEITNFVDQHYPAIPRQGGNKVDGLSPRDRILLRKVNAWFAKGAELSQEVYGEEFIRLSEGTLPDGWNTVLAWLKTFE